jgi:membrane associated rhomboid family serine protease
MNDATPLPHENILKFCAQAAPAPWYPAEFCRTMGMASGRLDAPLEQLRMAGLVELTDWVSGKGQGYRLTPQGEDVLVSPRWLARIRAGQLPTARESLDDEAIDPAFRGTEFGRGDAVLACLRRRTAPRVTQALMAANLLMFAAAFFVGGDKVLRLGGDEKTAHLFGSLKAEDLNRGQWWRLLSCTFVHFGPLHIALNTYALWVVGRLAERLWGHWRLLAIYVFSCLAGSCAAMAISHNTHLAGASGGVWGILCSLLAWFLLNRRYLPPRLVSETTQDLVVALILNGVISFLPGISWAGHFGGGLAGLITGGLLNQHRFETRPVRWVFIVLVCLVPVVSVGAVVRAKRSPAWLKIVQGEQQRKEEVQELQEKREIKIYNRDLAPALTDAREQADRALREAEDLRSVKPGKRDAESVKVVVKELQSAREKLDAALQTIDAAPKFESEFVGNAVRLGRSFCDHARKSCEMYEQCFAAGEKWTNEQENALNVQMHRTKDSRERYGKLIGE